MNKKNSAFLLRILIAAWFFACCAHATVGARSNPSTNREATTKTAETQDSNPKDQNVSPWRLEMTVRNRTGFRLNSPSTIQMSRTELDLKLIRKFGADWKLTMEGRAVYDGAVRLGYPRKGWYEPRQFLLDGKIKNVGVSLGLQQTVWGQADGLRVLDVVNPLDYREFLLEDFLDSRRPLWTVRADVPIKQASLQLIWVPYFAPARLPAEGDEFGLGESYGLGLLRASGETPLPFALKVGKAVRPPRNLKSSQFGAQWRQSFGNWDTTINFFRGWEDIPTPRLDGLEFSPTPSIRISPKFERKTVFGGTAATNFGPVVLRLEAGWTFNAPTAVTDFPPKTGFRKLGRFSSVVGLDYSPRSWLTVGGQYFLQFAAAPQRELVLPRTNHLASVFVRANFMRDTLRPELFVLTGLNRRQYMIRPRIVKTFGDHWSVGAGADFLGGERTNPFGFFTDRDRAVLELKWAR